MAFFCSAACLLSIAGVGPDWAWAAGVTPTPASTQPLDQEVAPAQLRQQIEADWLRQAKAREDLVVGAVSTQTDARGACDGIKDGKYAFHTGQERIRGGRWIWAR